MCQKHNFELEMLKLHENHVKKLIFAQKKIGTFLVKKFKIKASKQMRKLSLDTCFYMIFMQFCTSDSNYVLQAVHLLTKKSDFLPFSKRIVILLIL